MPEQTEVLVDAEGQIAGRLSSAVAKMLLEGKGVTIVNASKSVISGKEKMIFDEFQKRLEIRSAVHPRYTPRHYARPDQLLRRMIRGMLPRRKAKGAEAMKRLRVHSGKPEDVKGEPIDIEDVSANRLSHKYISLEAISTRFRGRGR